MSRNDSNAKRAALFDQVPPQNLEAEQSTLGACLIGGNDAFEEVYRVLDGDEVYYYREVHQRIFQVMCKLYNQGHPIDIVTVAEELRVANLMDAIGGAVYLTVLMDSVPTAANAEYYAAIVRERGALRRGIEFHNEGTAILYDPQDGWEEAHSRVLEGLSSLQPHKPREESSDQLIQTEMFYEVMGRTGPLDSCGMTTGFPSLDSLTDGFEPGELILLAARPSMGKSAVMAAFAQHAARSEPVTIYSLEMQPKALWRRIHSMLSGVPAKTLKRGHLSPLEEQQYRAAYEICMNLDLRIVMPGRFTTLEMRRLMREDAAKRGTKLVMLDYLQLMQGKGAGEREVMTNISREVKDCAREFDIPLVALSQLTRAVEKRGNRRPQMSDLLETGALEANADVIIGVYRPCYYAGQSGEEENREKPEPGQPEDLELIVLKERDGELGTCHGKYIANRTWAYEPEWS